ncbi:MAG: helix-turn-helix domain-containing protein [Phycisphaera sp.]|nr:helix-turn-helix domain-containing protein [Phycisphaera sp.]
MARTRKTPHVALLIETSRSYGRGLLRGVKRYVDEHGPWSLYVELRHLDTNAPPWLSRWRGDGILTRTEVQATANVIRRLGLPAVELRATHLRHDLPFVGVDNAALGRMVAEHLIDRGFTRFAVYDIDTQAYFAQRRDTFVKYLRELGHEVSVYHAAGQREKPREWEREQERLAAWVTSLPKPVGVLACTDQLGFWLLDACRRAGVAVPEEMAVVGAENDESLCLMSTPPLSSVTFNAERIGYEAARLLDGLMRGRGGRGAKTPTKPRAIEVPPIGIVTRQSSDVVAIADADIADAVRFIRENADRGITTEDVLDAVPMSRSSLERKMRAALGRSPKAEITRVRLEHVQRLLRDTDLTLERIARRTGFAHPQHLATLFKRRLGVTPGRYRQQTAGSRANDDAKPT